MIELLSGSVQAGECDIMGHMNVRHYLARGRSALASLGIALGLGPAALRARGLHLRVIDQHIRFNRELAPGTPFVIRGGVLERRGDTLRVLLEMRNVRKDIVAATMVDEIMLADGEGALSPAGVEPEALVELPEHAAPRGLSVTPPSSPMPRARADALGLRRIQLGMVEQDDCDPAGLMREESVIARIWDGLPHLTTFIRADAKLGGAALEYRIVYYRPARLGDVIETRCGLRAIGGKTTEWNYYLHDAETGEPIAAAASIGVAFDLATRKAVAPDEATLAAWRAQLVPELTI